MAFFAAVPRVLLLAQRGDAQGVSPIVGAYFGAAMRTTGLLVATLGTCQALTAYQRLTGATVLSVADRRPVELTSTWQGNERVVVEFLRPFG